MPIRSWHYAGYKIECDPALKEYKYLVWLSPSRVIAGRTLAELRAELDRL